jgi:histidinol-phosphate aminotransferase
VLNRLRGPFNVSSTAAAAGMAALADPNWVTDGRAHNTRARKKLERQLTAAGLKIHPGEANFLLADFLTPERAIEADQFLRSRGIIVRNVKSYGLPSCLRITIGTDEECELIAQSLEQFQTIPQKARLHG